MPTGRHILLTGVIVAGSVTLTGCFAAPWDRTGNQGGSNLVSMSMKLLGGALGAFNPDDLQVLTDLIIDSADVPVDPLSDELAQLAIDALRVNNIETIADLQAAADRIMTDPDSFVYPPGFDAADRAEIEQLIATLSDPATLQALLEQLERLGVQITIA